MYLTPDASEWDPYDEDYSERWDAFFDFRWYLIDRQTKQRKLIDDIDIYELPVSQEIYESSISSIVSNIDTYVFTSNEENNLCSNTQHDDMEFIGDGGYMQAGIVNLTAWFNDEIICKAVTEWAEKSKISMEADSIFFDGFNDIDDKMFEYSATHADTLKGITAEKLGKLWRVLNEVAQQTLDVTTQLNK